MDIRQVIEENSIEIHFQLILSTNIDLVAGIEALGRGIDVETNKRIMPRELFREANANDLCIELEKKLIKKAIGDFVPIHKENNNMLLFINISVDFFKYALETDYISKEASRHKIPFQNIALDIHPNNDKHLQLSCDFIKQCKAKGFYISLDNIGVDYFNLDTIIYLDPDIIKINIFSSKQLKNQFYAQNLIFFAKEISNKLGILIVTKGIENEENMRFSMNISPQYMQGYFISKPQKYKQLQLNPIISEYHEKIAAYKNKTEIRRDRKITSRVIVLTNQINKEVSQANEKTIHEIMENILLNHPSIENIWFLTKDGIEYRNTFINKTYYHIKQSPIFKIYQEGFDFSTKEIYRQLVDTILDIWVTDLYKSVLSNNLCVASSTYTDYGDNDLILCINFNYEKLQETM